MNIKNHLASCLIILAFISILVGIAAIFLPIEEWGFINANSNYVAAFFSLAGVMFYFGALMYQIKGYKLQVKELQKSIDAQIQLVESQTKTTQALEEQKNLLLDQNTNSLIFNFIENFNKYRDKNDIQEVIKPVNQKLIKELANIWEENLVEFRLNKKELNEKFASDIKIFLKNNIQKYPQHILLKNYVQFFYNLLIIIKKHKKEDLFTPHLYNQISTNERVIIHLSNLVDSVSGMPDYPDLCWSYHTTKEITDMISDVEGINFSLLNNNILTKEFKQLKQN